MNNNSDPQENKYILSSLSAMLVLVMGLHFISIGWSKDDLLFGVFKPSATMVGIGIFLVALSLLGMFSAAHKTIQNHAKPQISPKD
jgi:hypothetical protein